VSAFSDSTFSGRSLMRRIQGCRREPVSIDAAAADGRGSNRLLRSCGLAPL
jgi:hypothetical protein